MVVCLHAFVRFVEAVYKCFLYDITLCESVTSTKASITTSSSSVLPFHRLIANARNKEKRFALILICNKHANHTITHATLIFVCASGFANVRKVFFFTKFIVSLNRSKQQHAVHHICFIIFAIRLKYSKKKKKNRTVSDRLRQIEK